MAPSSERVREESDGMPLVEGIFIYLFIYLRGKGFLSIGEGTKMIL